MKIKFIIILCLLLTSCEKFVTSNTSLTLSGKYKVALLDLTSVDQNQSSDSLYSPGSVYKNSMLPKPFDSIPINRFYIHLDYSTIRFNQLGVTQDGRDIWEYGVKPNEIFYQVLNNNAYDNGYLRFTYYPLPNISSTLIFHIEKDGLESLQLQSTGNWVKGEFGEKKVMTMILTRVGP